MSPKDLYIVTDGSRALAEVVFEVMQSIPFPEETLDQIQCPYFQEAWGGMLRSPIIGESPRFEILPTKTGNNPKNTLEVRYLSYGEITLRLSNWLKEFNLRRYLPFSTVGSSSSLGAVFLNKNGGRYLRGFGSLCKVHQNTPTPLPGVYSYVVKMSDSQYRELASTMVEKIGHFEFHGEE